MIFLNGILFGMELDFIKKIKLCQINLNVDVEVHWILMDFVTVHTTRIKLKFLLLFLLLQMKDS